MVHQVLATKRRKIIRTFFSGSKIRKSLRNVHALDPKTNPLFSYADLGSGSQSASQLNGSYALIRFPIL